MSIPSPRGGSPLIPAAAGAPSNSEGTNQSSVGVKSTVPKLFPTEVSPSLMQSTALGVVDVISPKSALKDPGRNVISESRRASVVLPREDVGTAEPDAARRRFSLGASIRSVESEADSEEKGLRFSAPENASGVGNDEYLTSGVFNVSEYRTKDDKSCEDIYAGLSIETRQRIEEALKKAKFTNFDTSLGEYPEDKAYTKEQFDRFFECFKYDDGERISFKSAIQLENFLKQIKLLTSDLIDNVIKFVSTKGVYHFNNLPGFSTPQSKGIQPRHLGDSTTGMVGEEGLGERSIALDDGRTVPVTPHQSFVQSRKAESSVEQKDPKTAAGQELDAADQSLLHSQEGS